MFFLLNFRKNRKKILTPNEVVIAPKFNGIKIFATWLNPEYPNSLKFLNIFEKFITVSFGDLDKKLSKNGDMGFP